MFRKIEKFNQLCFLFESLRMDLHTWKALNLVSRSQLRELWIVKIFLEQFFVSSLPLSLSHSLSLVPLLYLSLSHSMYINLIVRVSGNVQWCVSERAHIWKLRCGRVFMPVSSHRTFGNTFLAFGNAIHRAGFMKLPISSKIISMNFTLTLKDETQFLMKSKC